MKRFLKRLFHKTKDWNQGPWIDALPQLVEPAEPHTDLLARIEAEIDAGTPTQAARSAFWRRWAGFICLLVVVSAISGTLGYIAGPERQGIEVRPDATADWMYLGAVSLHGSALRTFVRGKCKGRTHFYISVYGVSVGEAGPTQDQGEAPAQEGERILMECIF